MVPPDDYVLPDAVMEVMQDYMTKNYKINARIFSGFVDPGKFGLTMRLTHRSNLAYIGTRDMLHKRCVKFICCTAGFTMEYKWKYFVIKADSIFVFDPRTMLWGEFVEQMDQSMTGVKPEHECCLCMKMEDLVKCPQCTTRYCRECISGKCMQCFVCKVDIINNPVTKRMMVRSVNRISMNLGCLFKVLNLRFGMPTMHLLRQCEGSELAQLLLETSTDEKFAKYFDAKRYFTTAMMNVVYFGVSEQVLEAAAKTEIPPHVLEALGNLDV